MTTMFTTRLLCGLCVLAPVVLALQPARAAAQAQLAPVQRAPTYERQQKKINAWTVGPPLTNLLAVGTMCCAATKTVRVGLFQSTVSIGACIGASILFDLRS
jgi:hypothetical protein